MSLPMLLVWIIAFSVTLIVAWAAFSHRVKGEPIGMALATLASITFWITGLILGFFVTHFSSPTLETWWWALAIRVAWQIGGAVFFGIMMLADAFLVDSNMLRKPAGWIFVIICVAIGALASFNPIRDLIKGPAAIHGTADLEVVRRTRVKGGGTIRAELRLTTPDGARYELSMTGWPAEKAEELLAPCADTSNAEITMLRHIKRVLAVRCQ